MSMTTEEMERQGEERDDLRSLELLSKLLAFSMCNDTPCSAASRLLDFLEMESVRAGYDGWVGAYHHIPTKDLDEGMSDFEKGARAMFDNLMYRAANNFHGNPTTNKQCGIENELIERWAEDALDDVSPDSCSEWRDITTLTARIRQLEEAGLNG